jgi:hypothetical protein
MKLVAAAVVAEVPLSQDAHRQIIASEMDDLTGEQVFV